MAEGNTLVVTYTTKHGDDLFAVKVDEKDPEQRAKFQVCVLMDNDLDDYFERKPARAREFMTLVAAGEWTCALKHRGDDQHNRSITSERLDIKEKIDTAAAIKKDALKWLKEHDEETEKGDG